MWLPAAVLWWRLLLSQTGIARWPALWRTSESCPPTVQEHCVWASICLHCKQLAVPLGLVFLHQWCSRVRKVRSLITRSCSGAHKGRQCPKPSWSSCCCCDGACWLALLCVAGSSSSLVLSSSARAVGGSVCSKVNPHKNY